MKESEAGLVHGEESLKELSVRSTIQYQASLLAKGHS